MEYFNKENRLEQAAGFIRSNIKFILIAVIAAAAVAGVLMYAAQRRAEREVTARTLLEEAKRAYREGDEHQSSKHLETLLQAYGGTGAFGEALLYRGRVSIDAGDYDEAVSYFERYIERFPDGELLPEVYSELGYILEAKGEFEKAETFYSRIYTGFPEHYLAPKSMLDAARCLAEAGRRDEARALYESMLYVYPWSAFTDTAERELDRL